ncbi:head-tail joining protein [Sphingomonas sp. UYP23]
MSLDWDSILLAPVMGVFGEGDASQSAMWPIYYPTGLAPFALADAVFDRAYADVTLDGDGSENTTTKPCLGVRVSLFPREPAQEDTVYIPSVPGHFLVKDVRTDGHGHAKLILMGPVT